MANDVIFETVVTTVGAGGAVHVAPMGVRYRPAAAGGPDDVILMPFKPSTTYDNILASGTAVVNLTTDTRVFAGCVTGRRQWPTCPADAIDGVRLAVALGHLELRLAEESGDPARPTLRMRCVHAVQHAGFPGFNRAQAAVIEGAVLVSRLHLLPPQKIDSEMAYLQIAVDKTAGPAEREAWQWLQEAVAAHRAQAVTEETGR
jgi:hypothetical protein